LALARNLNSKEFSRESGPAVLEPGKEKLWRQELWGRRGTEQRSWG
jgi:hypothetical protein